MGLGLLVIFLGFSGLVITGVSYFYLSKSGNNVGVVNSRVSVPVTPRIIYCPRCNYNLSAGGFPRNFKEKLLGGWTCPNCSTKVDKLGNIKV